MKIQIFQHLPVFPKAGIFRPSPILCVAFQTFIPDRSAFRCSLSPVFLCSVPSSRCINPHTLSRTPPLPRATLLPRPSPHLPLHSVIPCIPTPAAPLPAQATGRQHQEAVCRLTTMQPSLPHTALAHLTHQSHRNPPHTDTHRPASRTGHQTPAPGAAHPPPPLYSLLLL